MTTALALPQRRVWQGAMDGGKKEARMKAGEREALGNAMERDVAPNTQRGFMRQANALLKNFTKRMDLLEQDIAAEEKGITGKFFYPVMVVYGGLDVANMIDLGTFTTIINWVVGVLTTVMVVKRTWDYASIRYTSIERQKRRARRVIQRAVFRAFLRICFAVLEAIPFVSFLPSWLSAKGIDGWLEKRHKKQLQELSARQRHVRTRMKRLQVRMRAPEARYRLGLYAVVAAARLEKQFDEL